MQRDYILLPILMACLFFSFSSALIAQPSQFDLSPPLSVDAGSTPGAVVPIPITLTNTLGVQVDAFKFKFLYPAELLTFQGLETTGTLTNGWTTVKDSLIADGNVNINGFDSEGGTTSSGVLVIVKFLTTSTSGSDSLKLTNFVNDIASATSTPGMLNSSVPVELVSFSANVVENTVRLSWATASETNNFGFDVEKSGDGLLFAKIGFVPGNGTTTVPQSYSFAESNVSPGKYFYRLKQIDTDGAFEHSNVIEATVLPPSRFSLFQNYPNPFNPETRIRFDIPNLLGEKVRVQLAIYNLFGQLVRTLVNEERGPGVHEINWDGRSDEGMVAPSGVYFYTVRAGEFRETKKMLFVR